MNLVSFPLWQSTIANHPFCIFWILGGFPNNLTLGLNEPLDRGTIVINKPILV
jgi:hypothetical protein